MKKLFLLSLFMINIFNPISAASFFDDFIENLGDSCFIVALGYTFWANYENYQTIQKIRDNNWYETKNNSGDSTKRTNFDINKTLCWHNYTNNIKTSHNLKIVLHFFKEYKKNQTFDDTEDTTKHNNTFLLYYMLEDYYEGNWKNDPTMKEILKIFLTNTTVNYMVSDKTPLSWATEFNDTKMIEFILNKKPLLKNDVFSLRNVLLKDDPDYKLADKLIENGANIDGAPNPIMPLLPLLTKALDENNFELFSYLLKKGANPNIKTGYYQTPIVIHAMKDKKYFKELLKYNPYLNVETADKCTTLNAAIETKDPYYIKIFLDAGVSLHSSVLYKGMYLNPVYRAIKRIENTTQEKEEIIEMLLHSCKVYDEFIKNFFTDQNVKKSSNESKKGPPKLQDIISNKLSEKSLEEINNFKVSTLYYCDQTKKSEKRIIKLPKKHKDNILNIQFKTKINNTLKNIKSFEGIEKLAKEIETLNSNLTLKDYLVKKLAKAHIAYIKIIVDGIQDTDKKTVLEYAESKESSGLKTLKLIAQSSTIEELKEFGEKIKNNYKKRLFPSDNDLD